MSRTKRTLIAIATLEALLLGGWLWLHNLAMTSSTTPDAGRVIGEVFGGAMGGLLCLAPLLYLMARNNDRRSAAQQKSQSSA
jgi:hypothetical protein